MRRLRGIEGGVRHSKRHGKISRWVKRREGACGACYIQAIKREKETG
jgi:hypothetical protein